MEAVRKDRTFTYADYLSWGEEIRCELIGGVVHMLAAPTWEHQRISMRLSRQLSNYLDGTPCEVFAAPFDVRLNALGRDDTVLQPDLAVICDHSKLSGTGCVGAPDMIIEILSPSTAGKDCLIKLNWYLEAGVHECWLVDPDSKSLRIYIMKDTGCVTVAYAEKDTVPVYVLDGCEIDLSQVFAE